MSFLDIDSIYKQYEKGQQVLSNFSIQIAQGEIWSLVGENGSGKSTLLRIIAGLEAQDSGKVYFHGNKVLNPTEKLVAGYEEIQLIHQQHHLYPHSTVEENIGRPLLLFDKEYKKERIEFILELLDLKQYRQKFPHELSGGQQQKVAIGRALSVEPEVLLLDEPFSSLDNIQKRELIGELKRIFKQLGITVLLVTHDIDDAMTMTDLLCILQKGRIIQKGNVQKIHEKPKNYYVAKLLSELNPIPGHEQVFIRPLDLLLDQATPIVSGRVTEVTYLIRHNQLLVLLENSSLEWRVEDRERKYEKGDPIHLSWDQENMLCLE